MASNSNTQTDMNPREQVHDLNQNQNPPQNVEHQSLSINPRNTVATNLSPTQHIDNNTYVFTTPINLIQNNVMLWRSQVISTIKANELKRFIDGSHVCPHRVFMNPRPNQMTVTTPNHEYKI